MFIAAAPSATRCPFLKIFGLSRVAWIGVWSLYSTIVGSLIPFRNRMAWPSPPTLVASGSTTPRANEVAIIASTTLPPFSITSRPASDASSLPETTTACDEVTAGLMSGCSRIMRSTTVSNAASSAARDASGRYLSLSACQAPADAPLE